MRIKACFIGYLLTAILHSCGVGKMDTGMHIMTKDSDTVTLADAITSLKAIDHELFKPGNFIGSNSISIQYRLLEPKQVKYMRKKKPLVVVFHGSGSIGNDNKSQMGILAKLWTAPEIATKYGAYVLVPQFPSRSSNYILDPNLKVMVSRPQACLFPCLELIDSLKKDLDIDSSRIYAVGFSMGGSTVINALSLRPDLFAAGVSISGIPQFDSLNTLATIPIWLIHGNVDTENPFSSDEYFYTNRNSKNTLFWVFENTAHEDIFSLRFLGDQIPCWLFSKVKR